MAENAVSPHEWVVFDAFPSHLQPVWWGEVDGLRQVVALVEPGVVGAGEGDDELTGTLVDSVNGNTVSLQTIGLCKFSQKKG